MKLTHKEKTMIFEISRLAFEYCGQWLAGLYDDNCSYFTPKEMSERLNWSKEKVAGVMSSLFEKSIITTDEDNFNINIPKSMQNDKEYWFIFSNNSFLIFLKELQADYPKYSNNIFNQEVA
jgi:hypothetical protein